ncbi:MAG: hypothetical protein KAS16_00185 [Thermoplasmata archaeon]|nr:hypothetical protein [Thermoplasmata archaeon]
MKDIKTLEEEIENALMDLECKDDLEGALKVYQDAEAELHDMGNTVPKNEYNRVLAYCLMRQANIFRQIGRLPYAMETSERGLQAAKDSGDGLTLARNLMDACATNFVTGKIDLGLEQVEEAKLLFQKGDSFDHKQGEGWYWILRADLVNAGIVDGGPDETIISSTKAIDILLPIENWQGLVRAYSSRATALKAQGKEDEAEKDRLEEEKWKLAGE